MNANPKAGVVALSCAGLPLMMCGPLWCLAVGEMCIAVAFALAWDWPR